MRRVPSFSLLKSNINEVNPNEFHPLILNTIYVNSSKKKKKTGELLWFGPTSAPKNLTFIYKNEQVGSSGPSLNIKQITSSTYDIAIPPSILFVIIFLFHESHDSMTSWHGRYQLSSLVYF